jgi:recombination protein RecA
MPATARADLEALLRARKLDRTLTSALATAIPGDDDSVVPTGLAELDARLEGGLPRGQCSELVGPRSSGRTSLLFSVLAGATRRGELVAMVDTFDMFDSESAVAAGLVLERMLWIRGRACAPVPLAYPGKSSLAETLIDRALKALMIVLQAGGFGVVVLDLADAPLDALGRLPFTTWLRLQRVIEGQATSCVLLAPAPVGRSAGGVTVALQPARRAGLGHMAGGGRLGLWTGPSGASRLFDGLTSEARIIRARSTSDAPCPVRLGAAPGVASRNHSGNDFATPATRHPACGNLATDSPIRIPGTGTGGS